MTASPVLAGTKARKSSGVRRRILVVDDSIELADTFSAQLKNLGHDVRTAEDGLSALEMTDEWHPEIVFLDLGLPGMSGYEVAHELRARGSATPQLVAVTGYGDERARQRSKQAGFALHLTKPADLDTIISILESFEGMSPSSRR